MPKEKVLEHELSETNRLLEKMLIIQLGLADVPQKQVRRIVGCSMSTVERTLSSLKVKSKGHRKADT
jgi:hypothetical protein